MRLHFLQLCVRHKLVCLPGAVLPLTERKQGRPFALLRFPVRVCVPARLSPGCRQYESSQWAPCWDLWHYWPFRYPARRFSGLHRREHVLGLWALPYIHGVQLPPVFAQGWTWGEERMPPAFFERAFHYLLPDDFPGPDLEYCTSITSFLLPAFRQAVYRDRYRNTVRIMEKTANKRNVGERNACAGRESSPAFLFRIKGDGRFMTPYP